MKVRIYAPAKTAMQSGQGKSDGDVWVVEGIPQTAKTPDSLMGWPTARDTISQIKLYFKTQEEAVQYATEKNLSYILQPTHQRRLKPKSYASNFTG